MKVVLNAENTIPGIPQHTEVPPDIEAKRIISYFSSILSRYSNNMLLKDE